MGTYQGSKARNSCTQGLVSSSLGSSVSQARQQAVQRELSAKMALYLSEDGVKELDSFAGSVSGATDAITNDPKFSAAVAAAINSIMCKEASGFEMEEGGVVGSRPGGGNYFPLNKSVSTLPEVDLAASRNWQVANRGSWNSG